MARDSGRFAAVADLDVAVLATIGKNNDPAAPTAPTNGAFTQFVSQQLVLERADAVNAHGGYGSIKGSLRHGRPVVSIPLPAPDNRLNASRPAELGAGIAIDADQRSPDQARDAITAICTDPSFTNAERRLTDEINALSPPTHAVTVLEGLANER